MVRWLVLVITPLLLNGCCASYRERVVEYARAAADQADTTAALIPRCQQGEQAACEQAVKSAQAAKAAAIQIAGEK